MSLWDRDAFDRRDVRSTRATQVTEEGLERRTSMFHEGFKRPHADEAYVHHEGLPGPN
jgi:hypothetical protein